MTIVRTVTPAGEAIVIMPAAEFDRLRDIAEDVTDARAVDASQDRLHQGKEELLTETDLDALRSAPTPLAFWRVRRAVSRGTLAERAGLAEDMVAALEAGTVTLDAATSERLAQALGVEAEDIVP